MLTDPLELGAWVRLVHRPGLGREAMRRLLAALGSPQAVEAAGATVWRTVIGPARAAALIAPAPQLHELAARTQAWLGQSPRRQVLVLGDADYPDALLQTADPPLILYLEGRVELLSAPSVAIVGSRSATPQGLDNARGLAAGLSAHGWTVVSGLAAGIDGAAHEGALTGPAGTIAVVGTGLDTVYPGRHAALAQRIVADGLLASEYPLGAPPLAAHFPQRNRIIAGLTRGTVVVEAALRSGSLITARLAAEAGREVFAVPGSIHSTQARGCHALLREGAKLVESVADILEELVPPTPARAGSTRRAPSPMAAAMAPAPPAAEPRRGDAVLDALGHDPTSLDALMARCGWDAAALNVRLIELELDGQVTRLPGGLYQRRGAA